MLHNNLLFLNWQKKVDHRKLKMNERFDIENTLEKGMVSVKTEWVSLKSGIYVKKIQCLEITDVGQLL